MKEKLIKIRSRWLIAILLALIAAPSVFAVRYSENGINYALNEADKTAEVTGGTAVDIIIPEKVTYEGNDYVVTSIKNYAFGMRPDCKSLVLPNTLTSIGDLAFTNCSNITGPLTIPNSVRSIGKDAFFYCMGLTGSLNIPDSVTYIGERAFYFCKGFTGTLTIPNSLTSIEGGVFQECRGLTGPLNIPNSVTSIGEQAFYGCKGLTGSLIIPNLVTSIGNEAFYACTGFTGSLILPNSLITIGRSAFWGCTGLSGALTIPNSVTTIGGYAFSYCTGFTGSLTLPSSLTAIEKSTFYSCKGFTGSLTIPESVTSIDIASFYGCSGFTGTLTLPKSLTAIGLRAFIGCTGFNNINCYATVPPVVEEKDTYENYNIPLNVPQVSLEDYKTAAVWKEFSTINPISDSENQQVKLVDLGLSVLWADRNYGATSPEDFGINYGWGAPSSTAFSDAYPTIEDIRGTEYDICTQSMGVEYRMPSKDELNELSKKCEWTYETRGDVNGFKVTGPNGNSIFIPAAGCWEYEQYTNRNINAYIWSGTNKLGDKYAECLHCHSTGSRFISSTGKWGGLIVRAVSDKSESFPIVKIINGIEYTLYENLTAQVNVQKHQLSKVVTIPSSIEYAGYTFIVDRIVKNALKGHEEVERINLLCTAPKVEGNVFAEMPNLKEFYYDVVKEAENYSYRELWSLYVFQNSDNLSTIIIGPNCKEIIGYFFKGMEGLETVSIPDNVEVIHGDSFASCPNLKTVTIGEGVIEIGQAAFAECKNLSQVFYNCASAKANIILPYPPFGDRNERLGELHIGDNVEYIGSGMFSSCKLLSNIYVSANTPPVCEQNSNFNVDVKKNATLYVPFGSLDLYKKAVGWKDFFTIKPIGGLLVESVTLDCDKADVKVGESIQLIAIVLPEDADDKSVVWTSSNEAVATVNANGIVTGVAEGNATVTATASNGVSASCEITVIPAMGIADQELGQPDNWITPKAGGVSITIDATSDTRVDIANMAGMVVESFVVPAGTFVSTHYDAERLAPGFYVVSATSAEIRITKRIVIR